MPPKRSSRDRRDRGLRGPAYGVRGACDLAPDGLPADRSPGERFDSVAISVMAELWRAWPNELGHIELAVEEVPILPERWAEDHVPMSSYVAAGTAPDGSSTPARIILLRRPIEHRAESRVDLEHLVLTVLVDQAAEIMGMRAEDVHPGYEGD